MCWVPLTRTPPRAAPLLGTARKGTPQHDSIQRNERCSARVALGPKRGPRPDAARPPDLNLDGPAWTRIYMCMYDAWRAPRRPEKGPSAPKRARAHRRKRRHLPARLQRAGGRTKEHGRVLRAMRWLESAVTEVNVLSRRRLARASLLGNTLSPITTAEPHTGHCSWFSG